MGSGDDPSVGKPVTGALGPKAPVANSLKPGVVAKPLPVVGVKSPAPAVVNPPPIGASSAGKPRVGPPPTGANLPGMVNAPVAPKPPLAVPAKIPVVAKPAKNRL